MPAVSDLRTGGGRVSKKKQAWITAGYAVMLALTFSVLTLGSPAVALTEVSIGSAHVEQNAPAAVPITIHNAADLGSVDLELVFNPAIVTVTTITAGDFDVTVTNLEETATGFVKIVAFQAKNPGLNGTVVLAQVTLYARAAVDSTTPLNISVNRMTDATPFCRDISYSVTNGSCTVISSAATPTPSATPPSETGGGGVLFSVSLDSDGDGYSDHYERLTGSDPNDPCDPDPTCSACLASRKEIPPVVATPGVSVRAMPLPSSTPSTPVPAIEQPAPPSAVPAREEHVLDVHKPPGTLVLILLAAILLSGLLLLAVSRGWWKLR
ncbi:MAG TPA: hypothetical protein ENN68_09430 [Methanomicrobia archaeon]|nr:hypothetical protein [Methanomicrobia archaeon]